MECVRSQQDKDKKKTFLLYTFLLIKQTCAELESSGALESSLKFLVLRAKHTGAAENTENVALGPTADSSLLQPMWLSLERQKERERGFCNTPSSFCVFLQHINQTKQEMFCVQASFEDSSGPNNAKSNDVLSYSSPKLKFKSIFTLAEMKMLSYGFWRFGIYAYSTRVKQTTVIIFECCFSLIFGAWQPLYCKSILVFKNMSEYSSK